MRNPFRSRVKTPAVDPDIMITAELIAYFHDEMETERDADRHGSEVYQVAQSFRDDALDSLTLLVDHKIRVGAYA